MKRISLILLATVAIFASCSKHNDAPVVIPEEPWLSDLSLPVPIQFSSTNAITKAGIDPADDKGNFPGGLSIGILGANNDGNYWYATLDGGYLWHDGTSPYVAELVTAYDERTQTGSVDFRTPHYYPIYSDKSYDFYGYFPYRNELGNTATVGSSSSADGSTITYALGNVDILWAHAVGQEYQPEKGGAPVKGFNAKYIRAVTKDGVKDSHLPSLNFEHKLSKITFEAISGTDTDNEAISITNVDITGNYNKVTLIVAARSKTAGAADLSGTFTSLVKGNVPLYNDKDQTELNVYPKAHVEGSAADLSLGYAFILPTDVWTSDLQGNNLTVDIYLAQNGVSIAKPQTVKIPYPIDGYKAGYEYNYRIVVYDAQKVEVKVSLKKIEQYDGEYDDPDEVITGDTSDDNEFVLYD